MGWTSIIIGVVLAFFVMSLAPKVKNNSLRGLIGIIALLCVFVGIAFSSVRYIAPDRVGIVEKHALGTRMSSGSIIATDGMLGVQADVLYPGWHFWYWPVVYDVKSEKLMRIDEGMVGLVKSTDGRALSDGQVFADEVTAAEFEKMVKDPAYFLTDGSGQKGLQTNVLTPGTYRLNPALFEVNQFAKTTIEPGTVGVIKSNVGADPSIEIQINNGDALHLAARGEKGIRTVWLEPGAYPLNTLAFEVIPMNTREKTIAFTKLSAGDGESEITVRSSDGFTFPVDIRVEYKIDAKNAPMVVSRFGSNDEEIRKRLRSAVRAIFRNNAERVKALDYVNNRSEQESKSTLMLAAEMNKIGLTVTNVRIGDVGDEASLGELLTTQTDREIALQKQTTFQVQQRAAEQEKELTRTEQEAEEEKRLATARYEVKIAEQDKERVIIAARAEAESIEIRAKAQAEQFRVIAEQIGSGNAALIELLKVIGERGIQITPRVMVTGGDAGASDGQTTALIGTMLDTMIAKDDTGG
jgi:uncharacterized membrane protein YqiK